jgi:CubicO group peptidase (beta-lactamase class C family)
MAAAQSLTPAQQSAVDAVFAQYTKRGSPGCAVGIYRDGAVVYSKGYGLAALENEVPISAGTVFDIGSTSKQFTAFSILLLEQQGKLSLDDDVRKYIPELPDYGRTITLRHMLSHTSGLRDYAGLFEFAGIPEQDLTTDQDALDLIVRQKRLNFMPGEEWGYSNSGFFLLSQVVKRVSGKSIRDFAQENIFKPLGMEHTQIFDWHGLVIPRRATGYTYDDDRKTFAVEMSNFEQAGDGSVQTSVEDLLRWDENFYTGKVGGPELMRKMQTIGTLNNGQKHGYGLALFLATYRGQPTVRHGGAWAGYRAELLRFPQQHSSFAVLCNVAQAEPWVYADSVADVVLASVLGSKTELAGKAATPLKVADDAMRGHIGWYRNAAGEYFHITFKDGKLFAVGSEAHALVADSDNDFHVGLLNFSFNEDEMRIRRATAPAVTFKRVEERPVPDLSRFAGRYYSDELQNTWEFLAKDGELRVGAKNVFDKPEPLVPFGDDTFTLLGGEVRFVGKPGEPMHAFVTLERIRGLDFVRRDEAARLGGRYCFISF